MNQSITFLCISQCFKFKQNGPSRYTYRLVNPSRTIFMVSCADISPFGVKKPQNNLWRLCRRVMRENWQIVICHTSRGVWDHFHRETILVSRFPLKDITGTEIPCIIVIPVCGCPGNIMIDQWPYDMVHIWTNIELLSCIPSNKVSIQHSQLWLFSCKYLAHYISSLGVIFRSYWGLG